MSDLVATTCPIAVHHNVSDLVATVQLLKFAKKLHQDCNELKSWIHIALSWKAGSRLHWAKKLDPNLQTFANMKYVLELFSVLRMFLNYSKIVHSILCITSLSVPKNKVVYNSHLWIQIKFPFYYCLPFCFPPSHCLDIAWSGRPPPYIYIYIYILVEKLSCIYIY